MAHKEQRACHIGSGVRAMSAARQPAFLRTSAVPLQAVLAHVSPEEGQDLALALRGSHQG